MSHIGTFAVVPGTIVTTGAIYSLTCDSGTANELNGVMQLSGDSINIITSGAGNSITISLSNDVAIQGQLKCNSVEIESGNLFMDSGVVVLGILGPQLVAGAGDPNGSVNAPQGSLYLRTDGSSTTTRAYINTDSGTTWTGLITNS
jgi:hypothetical protein